MDSPPTNSINLTLLHITSRAWSRPHRRRGRRPLGMVAVLSSRHDDFNDCLDVVPDILLHWHSVCSLATQSLTFCLLHPCSIALSTHQLHHQVFPASNLNALPVPNAKQVFWKVFLVTQENVSLKTFTGCTVFLSILPEQELI